MDDVNFLAFELSVSELTEFRREGIGHSATSVIAEHLHNSNVDKTKAAKATRIYL